jgi:hypothetical protein
MDILVRVGQVCVVVWVSIDTGIETSSAEQAHLHQVHPHCIMWVISLLPHIGTHSFTWAEAGAES